MNTEALDRLQSDLVAYGLPDNRAAIDAASTDVEKAELVERTAFVLQQMHKISDNQIWVEYLDTTTNAVRSIDPTTGALADLDAVRGNRLIDTSLALTDSSGISGEAALQASLKKVLHDKNYDIKKYFTLAAAVFGNNQETLDATGHVLYNGDPQLDSYKCFRNYLHGPESG